MIFPLIGSSNHDVTLISIIFLMSQKIEVILLAKTTDSVCGPRPFWTELCLGAFYTQAPLGALVQDLSLGKCGDCHYQWIQGDR